MASLPLVAFDDGETIERKARAKPTPPFLPKKHWEDEDEVTPRGKMRFRTVWISDTHLGTAGLQRRTAPRLPAFDQAGHAVSGG